MIRNRAELEVTPQRSFALDCVEIAIEASDPARVLTDSVSLKGHTLRVEEATYDLASYDQVLVVGGGKAAARQARTLERILGDSIEEGIVVSNERGNTNRIQVLPGDHPIPSEEGVESTNRLLALAERADEQTLVIVLLTGGGSALLPAPVEGVSIADLQTLTNSLLESGATIHEINAVRKHCSKIKGGGLARAISPGKVVALVMSDVVGDDLSVIASGPTVPDDSTFEDALSVLRRFDIEPPESIRAHLDAGKRGTTPETPSPGDEIFERVDTHLIADAWTPLEAAVTFARDSKYRPFVLSSRIRGEAREAAKSHVAVGEEILATGTPVDPPAVVFSGGETTVTVRGNGRGGPNQEYALGAAIELSPKMTMAAVDTDGIDGATEAAGAIVDDQTVTDRSEALAYLDRNDAYSYLTERAGIIETGPTGTNVNDFRLLLVERE